MKLGRLLAVALLVVGSACSDEPRTEATSGEPSPEVSAHDGAGGADTSDGDRAAGTKKDADRAAPGSRARGAGSTGASGTDSNETGAEDDSSSAYVPAQGTYSYEQSGFEEFCDAATCDRQDLPPTQTVRTSYAGGSDRNVIVVTEARASSNRVTRTTTKHTPEGAWITNVRVKFSYEGVTFDNSYQPDPPVEAVRYPLRSGDRWSGEWRDSTSGEYSIAVGDKEAVTVGDSTVQAFPLLTVTTFHGELDGKATVTVWIDPATAAPVKMEGRLRAKSVFGTYRTEFSAVLESAPRYR